MRGGLAPTLSRRSGVFVSDNFSAPGGRDTNFYASSMPFNDARLCHNRVVLKTRVALIMAKPRQQLTSVGNAKEPVSASPVWGRKLDVRRYSSLNSFDRPFSGEIGRTGTRLPRLYVEQSALNVRRNEIRHAY